MTRRNYPKHSRRIRPIEDNFDCIYVDVPERPEVARVISVPRKAIFINLAASPAGETIRQTRTDRLPFVVDF